MGGFGDALRELLGGWNAVRRIDKEGFDWREKAQQAELERQQQAQQFQQQNEDWATRAATEASLGGAEDQELASLIPDQVNRARVMARTRGAGLQSKSALKGQDLYNRQIEQQQRQAGALEQIGARGDEAQELAELQAKLRAKAPMTAYETERMRVLEVAANRVGRGGGRTFYDKVPGENEGTAGTWRINRQTGEREFFPAARTAATRGKEEARGAAMQAYDELMGIYDSFGGQPQGGLEARLGGLTRGAQATAGYNPEVQVYKAGVRGFVPLMARALGHVGVLTELDVERTEALFPKPGDTETEAMMKKAVLSDIMSGRRQPPFQLQTAPAEEPSMPPSTAGEGEIRTFNGRKYRLKPGADKRLRSSWEEL